MRFSVILSAALVLPAAVVEAQPGEGELGIWFIDTEGGQSTLFVSPDGESLLVDTGNPGERDLARIVATLDEAAVTQIDHLWSTHYHGDHIGSLLALAERVPVLHYYDHGEPHANDRIVSAEFLAAYEELSRGKRTVVRPGDRLPMDGVDIITVASDGVFLGETCPGAAARIRPATASPPSTRAAISIPTTAPRRASCSASTGSGWLISAISPGTARSSSCAPSTASVPSICI